MSHNDKCSSAERWIYLLRNVDRGIIWKISGLWLSYLRAVYTKRIKMKENPKKKGRKGRGDKEKNLRAERKDKKLKRRMI